MLSKEYLEKKKDLLINKKHSFNKKINTKGLAQILYLQAQIDLIVDLLRECDE